MKAYMICKASSVSNWYRIKEELERMCGKDSEMCKVVIEKTITLTPGEFAAFSADLLDYKDFITENRALMRRDEKGVRHCIKVTARGSKYSILVESEGYDYARYTAIITK